MIRIVKEIPDYAPVGLRSALRHNGGMEFDAPQRRQALQAFMDREKLKPAPWERQAGIGDGTVRKFLAGQSGTLTDKTYHALAVAAAARLGRPVPVAELQGVAAPTPRNLHETAISDRIPLRQADATIPPLILWRSVPGGRPEIGGWILSSDKTGEVPRPDFLFFSARAFALTVLDDRNAPAYRTRDTALVDPDSPVTAGDDCIFTADPGAPGGAETVLGSLVSSTAVLWKIRQYASKRERELHRSEFPNAWLIVGRYNRR